MPTNKRPIGMVFQSYAIWPHMTVSENVAYPLTIQRRPKAEIKKKVGDVLRIVGLDGLEDRPAPKLSGGQQQRVAFARALVNEPKVMLLDEPLSNLDAKLRVTMRGELKRLHLELKRPFIYVTHDQVEALTMSSNIAVMKQGIIQQLDTPDRVYHFPSNLFVADFIGNPKVNLLEGTTNGENCVQIADFKIPMNTHSASGSTVVAVRPEDVVVCTKPEPDAVEFKAYSVLPAGAASRSIRSTRF